MKFVVARDYQGNLHYTRQRDDEIEFVERGQAEPVPDDAILNHGGWVWSDGPTLMDAEISARDKKTRVVVMLELDVDNFDAFKRQQFEVCESDARAAEIAKESPSQVLLTFVRQTLQNGLRHDGHDENVRVHRSIILPTTEIGATK